MNRSELHDLKSIVRWVAVTLALIGMYALGFYHAWNIRF